MTRLIELKLALYHELIKQDMNKLDESTLDMACLLSTDRDIRNVLSKESENEKIPGTRKVLEVIS